MKSPYPIKHRWLAGLALLAAQTLPAALLAATSENTPAPRWETRHSFEQLGWNTDSLLLGIRSSDQVEFRLRGDRLATAAQLHLEYTPSPSLLAGQSHVRVYLNDALMGVLPAQTGQPGQRMRQSLPLDPQLLGDFNRLRLEFVGRYDDACPDPASSALWLNLARNSRIELTQQALAQVNDLAYFPAPFFDERDYARLELPVLFAATPTLEEQRAAAILASYFGSLAGWRRSSFPVHYQQLPPVRAGQPLLVLASNERRPAFLQDYQRYPRVESPVVQLIDHPSDPYGKLLLILGRDDADLVSAATALAMGGELFNGQRVAIERPPQPQPRRPYDAPNWVPTDRPVRFAELLDYAQQLQVSGLKPKPISLDLNLPPDLFAWSSQGVPLTTRYRYTAPGSADDSRLNVSINEQFIASLPLAGESARQGPSELSMALWMGTRDRERDKLLVPALKLGEHNRLRFEFDFASLLGSSQRDRCQTVLPVNVQAAIDEDSTIDLSGFQHYIALPELRAFARSGFPFSRLADLSQTLVLVPSQPSPTQVGTLLDALAGIAAQVGYPALGVRLSDDWRSAAGVDADLLLLGPLPAAQRSGQDLSALQQLPRSWLTSAAPQAEAASDEMSATPLAAIVGLQSPFHPQRSVVALLASSEADHALLRTTLGDPGKLDAIDGSLALIRDSGIASQRVGETYYVGHLPWWQRLWFHMSERPLLLASMAALSVLLLAWVCWLLLRLVSRRRLSAH